MDRRCGDGAGCWCNLESLLKYSDEGVLRTCRCMGFAIIINFSSSRSGEGGECDFQEGIDLCNDQMHGGTT